MNSTVETLAYFGLALALVGMFIAFWRLIRTPHTDHFVEHKARKHA